MGDLLLQLPCQVLLVLLPPPVATLITVKVATSRNLVKMRMVAILTAAVIKELSKAMT